MVLKKLHRLTGLLLAGAMAFASLPMLPVTARAEVIVGTPDHWKDKDVPTLRDYATPSANYVGVG